MAEYETLRQYLTAYMNHAAEISRLSTPSVQEIEDADAYQRILSSNNHEIAALLEENNRLMQEFFLPVLEGDAPLEEAECHFLQEFAEELQDTTALELMDVSLLWRIAERLLEDAKKKGDPDGLVKQIDSYIVACMGKLAQLKCLPDSEELWHSFHSKGVEVVELMFHLLEKEQFAKIQDVMNRRILLVNSRYFCVVYDVPGLEESVKNQLIDRLIQSFNLADDPFYREMAPGYNWFKHRLKCCEYIGQLAERNNELGFTQEQCRRIYPYALKLEEYYEQQPEQVSGLLSKYDIDLIVVKAKYFAGEMTRKEYCSKLLQFYKTRAGKSSEVYSLFSDFQLPNDYIGNLDRNNLTEEEMAHIDNIYQSVISDIFKLPNKDSLSSATEYVARMMEQYIEIPGGMTFREFYLKMLAAVWPQAYIHARSTSQLTRCICGHLIESRPEIFLGMYQCNAKEDVWKRKDIICAFAYNAALVHDVGLVTMLQIAGIAERELFEEEQEILSLHPKVGAKLAGDTISTRAFAHVILEHDRTYTDETPHDEQRPILDIIYMADHLDDYAQEMEKRGLTAVTGDWLSHLQETKDEGFAPYLLQLCKKEEVHKDLEFLLSAGRKAIYRQTYVMLKEVQDRGKK